MAKSHQFRLVSTIGPPEILRSLEIITSHPNQAKWEPQFEFDWIARKLVLSANSAEGLEVCRQEFERQMNKYSPVEELFIVGKPRQTEGSPRLELPIGVLMQDAATYGELIGRSLVDLGVRGIRVADQMQTCQINVQLGPFTGGIDFQTFVRQFPLPKYLELYDDGEAEMPSKSLTKALTGRSKLFGKKKQRR